MIKGLNSISKSLSVAMDQVMQNCKRGVSTGTCKSKLKFSYNKLLSASAYIVKTV